MSDGLVTVQKIQEWIDLVKSGCGVIMEVTLDTLQDRDAWSERFKGASTNAGFFDGLMIEAAIDTATAAHNAEVKVSAIETYIEGMKAKFMSSQDAPAEEGSGSLQLFEANFTGANFWGTPTGFMWTSCTNKVVRLTFEIEKTDEATKAWRALCIALDHRNTRHKITPPRGLRQLEFGKAKSNAKLTPHTGPRQEVPSVQNFRLTTSDGMRNTYLAMAEPWKNNKEGSKVYAEKKSLGTQVSIDCDDTSGFGADAVIAYLLKNQPSLLQMAMTLAGYWYEQVKVKKVGQPGGSNKPHEQYIDVTAQQLMQFQNRAEAGKKGGYHNDEIVERGKEIAMLQRMTIPKVTVKKWNPTTKRTEPQKIKISALFVIQTIEQRLADDGYEGSVAIRYHIGEELYEWLCGENPIYARLSTKILRYNSHTHRYHILLGVALANYERTNRKHRKSGIPITLPALLEYAGIEIPERNIDRFLERIEKAINDLHEDDVWPGVKIEIPRDTSEPARIWLSKGKVIVPPSRFIDEDQQELQLLPS
ncbi:MAG: hypothetical protein V4671_09545 [Armatimonadota bacterium]